MTDRFENMSTGLTAPALDAFAITPDDNSDLLEVARALYVGGGGDVALITKEGNSVTFVGVSAGQILPVRVKRALLTGTTATNIVGLV